MFQRTLFAGVLALLVLSSNAQALSFTPISGPVNTLVTIASPSGGFDAGTQVYFNGVPAQSVTFLTSTQVRAKVSSSAISGPITTVNSAGQSTTSSASFSVVPSLGSHSPAGGYVGQTVTLSGSNFNPNPSANSVTFGGVGAQVLSVNSTTMTVAIPPNAISGNPSGAPLNLKVSGVAALGNGTPFTIYCPTGDTVSTIAVENNAPFGAATDSTGNLFFVEGNTIRKRTPAGAVSIVAGSDIVAGHQDGPSEKASFMNPQGVAVDALGNIFVADTGNSTIREISGGTVSTLAGSAGQPGYVDKMTGPLSDARFNSPTYIAADGAGNTLYVSDSGNHVVRRIKFGAAVRPSATTIAGAVDQTVSSDGTPGAFSSLTGIALDAAGNVFVGDANSIRKLTPNLTLYTVSTLAGSLTSPGYQDGASGSALFWGVRQIAFDKGGNLWVADSSNQIIREVTAGGTVLTAAGLANAGGTVDDMGSAARFNYPTGIALDPSGNVYVTEPNTNLVRKIALAPNCPAPTCSSATAPSPIAYNAPTQTVTAHGLANAETVRFDTWNTGVSPPQSDKAAVTVSVDATDIAGTFQMSQFDPSGPVYLTFQTDVYVTSPSYFNNVQTLKCATTTWTRNLPPPPNPPLSVTVPSSVHSASVSVSWVPDTTGPAATYFVVKRTTSPTDAFWPTVGTPSASPLADELPGFGTYSYKVAACNTLSGCSAFTAPANTLTVSSPAGVVLQAPGAEVVDTPPTHDASVGTMSGAAGTDGGAATYTVPIVVPPGRAGMQPALSLSYNSRSGNGVMGMGWMIAGLSSIHRCPQTLDQDGVSGAVSYGANDRLCLDGQRLVLVSGTYGMPGAQYSTEIDSYARITQVDTQQVGGSGLTDNTCFRVEQKDGRVLYYGDLVNGTTSLTCAGSGGSARVKPFNASAPLSWLVARIADRAGNYESFSYSDPSGGYAENLLQTVTYTLPDASSPRTVNFAYEARTTSAGVTDVASSYLAGGLTMQTQRLQSITTKVGSTVVRTYTPSYVAAEYSGRLLMSSLKECATNTSGTACHEPTRFYYNDSDLYFELEPLKQAMGLADGDADDAGGSGAARNPNTFGVIGDLDGDGTREVSAIVWRSDGERVYLEQMTGDRAIQSAVELTGTPFAAAATADFDIDGSGRSALIQYPASSGGTLSVNTWKLGRGVVATAQASPTQSFNALFDTYSLAGVTYTFPAVQHAQKQAVLVADLDADGKQDLIIVQEHAGCGGNLGVFFYRNRTSGALSKTAPANSPQFDAAVQLFCLARTNTSGGVYEETIDHIGDFNGDGRPDFFINYAPVFSGAKSTNDVPAFSRVMLTGAGASSVTSSTPLVRDVTAYSATDQSYWQHGYIARWMDVNGDGLEDFLIARPQAGDAQQHALPIQWFVALNRGNGTLGTEIGTGSTDGLVTDDTPNDPVAAKTFRYSGFVQGMDVDSDGKPELLIPSKAQGFAVKMCTLRLLPRTQGADGYCPGTDHERPLPPVSAVDMDAPNTLITSSAPSGVCAAWSCPEDVDQPATVTVIGTDGKPHSIPNLSLPPNTLGGAGPAFPYQWPEDPLQGPWPAFAAHDDLLQHNGPGGDNSTYHVAALKFVMTDATHISLRLIETPLIAGSNGLPRADQDLFGDGLSDLSTTIGCADHPYLISAFNGDNPHYESSCTVIGDSAYGGKTTLPDGTTPTAGFATNAVLYANINQGSRNLAGSAQRALAGAPQAPVPHVKQVASATPILGVPIMPGLMDGLRNGLLDETSWGYRPLSAPDTTYGFSFYSVPSGGGYVDDKHYYFQSSMPVVYGMLQGPANGSGHFGGFRSAEYGYVEAMYNHYGRGFQGFRQIRTHIDTANADAAPEIQNRSRDTITTFNQKFPLVGKVACSHTLVPSKPGVAQFTCDGEVFTYTGLIVEEERDTWVCDGRNTCPSDATIAPSLSTGGTRFAPVLDTQTAKDYDLGTGAQYAQTDTTNANGTTSGWDGYGNLTDQTVVHSDMGASAFLSSHTTVNTNTYANDAANWWVNNLTNSTVSSSMVYSGAHAYPGGGNPPLQMISTDLQWNPDRTPATKVVQGDGQHLSTAYCYPQSAATALCPATTSSTSYGLPTSIKICLGTYDGSGVCVPDNTIAALPNPSALSPERSTALTYTNDGVNQAADGYFVLTTKNALNQTTNTTHQTVDGQVLQSTDPNNVKVRTTYDPFGRATEVDHLDTGNNDIEPPLQVAYNSCAKISDTDTIPAGQCDVNLLGETGGYETSAAYRITTVQEGAPTKIVWQDVLGREVKTAQRGFDGSFVNTQTRYDDMGTVSVKYTPYYAGASSSQMFFTLWSYDALNRPIYKDEDRAGVAADFITRYHYAGRGTTIYVYASDKGSYTASSDSVSCVNGARNLCVSMSRLQNALGQYMQTTDALGGATNYWTEPLGHITAMQDAETNVTKATYNALGQRTRSNDPDQGQWDFTCDALGELLTQADARGVTTTVNSRDALGRVTEQQQVPPSGALTGLDPNIVVDVWSYDPSGAKGMLGTVTRYHGTSRTTPYKNSNPQIWQEQYTYDAAKVRPTQITTTIAGAGSSFISAIGYDSDGRPSTHTYPDNFIAKTLYGPYGQPAAIASTTAAVGGTDTVLWKVLSMDAWNKATAENYADGVASTISYYQSTGQQQSAQWTMPGSVLDSLSYNYDSLGNLTSQTRTANGLTNTESYSYDVLQRLSGTTRTRGNPVNYDYTASGNLKYKDDFSINSSSNPQNAYAYAGVGGHVNNCGPHAANSVSRAGVTVTYTCDANGNVIGGSTLTGTYDADNRPTSMTRSAAGTQTWLYDADGRMMVETSSAGTRYFGPSGYEQRAGIGYHELGPIIVERSGTTNTVTTALRDRLGSTIATVDGGIQFPNSARGYDAFGTVRYRDLTDKPPGTLGLADTIHGFTQHDHADDVQVIHMGGRVYDYSLGRFLSVDPIIGNPLSSQSLNPYSYIGNNPLSGTDPTGYACSTGTHISGDSGPSCDGLGVSSTITAVYRTREITVKLPNGETYRKETFSDGNTTYTPLTNGAMGAGTKPGSVSDGSKNGIAGFDGVERDPGQGGMQRALNATKPSRELAYDALDAVTPHSAGEAGVQIVAGPIIRLGAKTIRLGAKMAGATLLDDALTGIADATTLRSASREVELTGVGVNGQTFRGFSDNNFRENLFRLTGNIPAGAQAHHVFPQAKEFSKAFEELGINVHDPHFGAWWNGTAHNAAWAEYNAAWRGFFAQGQRTPAEAFGFARDLSQRYGYKTNF